MNFTALDNKGTVDGFCLIKTVDKKVSSKGDTYLDLLLADKDGEINAKLWSYSPDLHGEYEANQIIKVRGTISVYNGNDQLRIDRIRHTYAEDNINPEDYVKTAEYDSAKMYDALYNMAENFADDDLSRLVKHILTLNREALLYWPAAFKLHHAIRGGLLMHTLSIARLAESVCAIYPFVDKDLLLSGVILHDIAKITEFTVAESGVVTGYSIRGNLLGHLTEGAMTVRKVSEEIGVPAEKSMLIEHMILSHHGEPEFGAAVRPAFIEAELLSELDLMDARIYEMREAVESTAALDFTGKLWAMDNRKLFNHSRTDLTSGPKLF